MYHIFSQHFGPTLLLAFLILLHVFITFKVFVVFWFIVHILGSNKALFCIFLKQNPTEKMTT